MSPPRGIASTCLHIGIAPLKTDRGIAVDLSKPDSKDEVISPHPPHNKIKLRCNSVVRLQHEIGVQTISKNSFVHLESTSVTARDATAPE